MPKHTNLLKRNGRYYFNLRIPKELRAAFGKETIRKALGTSDKREAIRSVRYQAFKAESDFAEKRREMERAGPSLVIRQITDREAHEMVFRWFVEQEKLSENWNFETGSKMDEHERDEVLDVLRTDAVVYCHH
jgi:hypothetical protein